MKVTETDRAGLSMEVNLLPMEDRLGDTELDIMTLRFTGKYHVEGGGRCSDIREELQTIIKN